MKSCISVQNLSVNYQGRQVLKDISLEIPENQITAIIGPSGCGKTTLLKSLNRLVELRGDVGVSGKVLLKGTDIFGGGQDVTELRKRVGYIAQTPNPLPMSVFDNVAYGPKIHGAKKAELKQVVEKCLKDAGLWDEVKDRLNSPASQLSVGQQQRLCLARALAVKPEVLLCDEPTSALDPISTRNIEEHLSVLKDEYTIVFVTHILRQARRLADHVAFIYFGELVEYGPAKEFFSQPRDQRTKAYLGGEVS